MSDQRIDGILDDLKNGKTREQIAEKMGYKNYRSLDMFMRRNGYSWNKKCYFIRVSKPVEVLMDDVIPSTEVARILSLFANGEDARSVAALMGYKDHYTLADYMSHRGYKWVDGAYIYSANTVSLDVDNDINESESKFISDGEPLSEASIIKWLSHHRCDLESLLGPNQGQIPRYLVPGIPTTKSVHMSHALARLMKDYCREKNISQRDLVETAVIELMKKYGYMNEMNALLKNS